MIEYDVRTYLIADATLQTLLGGSAGDRRIYPDDAPQGTDAPYIVYSTEDGPPDENIHTDRLLFRIVGTSKLNATNIRNRIRVLLDVEDSIRGQISSSDYIIYYSKLVSGLSMADKEDTSNIKKVIMSIYEFRFNDLT